MPDNTPELPAILPGDVVQITDRDDAWFGGFVLIEEVHGWGFGAKAPSGGYIRLKLGQFMLVGPAPMAPADVVEARRDAMRTAAEVARDAGK